jgi:outer membrane lipoprotein SlyB
MNTNLSTNHSTTGGVHRGLLIGGGLLALATVALATALVMKNNEALPGSASAATLPLVAVADTARAPVHHVAARSDNVTRNSPPQGVAACETCGVVEGYSVVQVQGQNSGVGAVAGGVGGALLGSKVAGRGNHTLGGAIGAVGGGLLGNAIESHERLADVYDVRVRMADGSVRTVRQFAAPAVGAHVSVDGNVLRPIDAQG